MQSNSIDKINALKSNLDSKYWEDIQKESYMGVDFDITAVSKISISMTQRRQRLMVKHYPALDEDTLSNWVKKYWEVNRQTKKLIDAHLFILCIIAETISENALKTISTLPFKNYKEIESKGERGCAFIVDIKSQQIYGICPAIPIPIRKRCQSVLACLKDTYHISEIKKSPKPEVTAERMKSDLKKWGYGLIGFGALHIVLASVLDPIWGVILIILGLCNLFMEHRVMFLLDGLAIMTAAIFNGIAVTEADIPAFNLLIIMQFVWGILEIRKFKLYDEVK